LRPRETDPPAPSATGNVLANDTDVDSGDSKTVTAVAGSALNVGQPLVGTYGTLTLLADGTWSHALNNADPDTNALAQGQTVRCRGSLNDHRPQVARGLNGSVPKRAAALRAAVFLHRADRPKTLPDQAVSATSATVTNLKHSLIASRQNAIFRFQSKLIRRDAAHPSDATLGMIRTEARHGARRGRERVRTF
jgi:VCBS repeat-containing protein